MFIDVTRHGGVVLLRLAVPAIAYLSETPTGCAIHLIGGETIRANEGRDDIEGRIAALSGPAVVNITPDLAADAAALALVDNCPPVPAVPEPSPATQQGAVSQVRTPHHQNGRKKR